MNNPLRKRLRILWTIALVVILGGLAWLTLRPRDREPVYQGKRLSQWLADYEPFISIFGVTPYAPQIDIAIRAIGTNAIPTLLRVMDKHDSHLKEMCYGFLERYSMLNIHHVPERIQYGEATLAFRALGPRAAGAVPQLVDIYGRSQDAYQRGLISDILRHLGPLAKEAVPIFVLDAKSTNVVHRTEAIIALGQIHSNPSNTLPVLIEALQDTNGNIRQMAVTSLWAFRKDAAPAMPALLDLWKKEPSYQLSVTLLSIDPEAAARAGVK